MDSNILDSIDMRQLGKDSQAARRQRGMTQEAVAEVLGMARTTITAIEKGERRLKADELITLARAYGRQVSDFVHPRPRIEPFQPQFRAQFRGPYAPTPRDEQAIAPFITTLEALCRDYLELEEIMQAPLLRKYPPRMRWQVCHPSRLPRAWRLRNGTVSVWGMGLSLSCVLSWSRM